MKNTIDNNNVTFLLTAGGVSGRWAKGATLGQAAIGLKKAGAKKSDLITVWIVFNDPTAVINEWGAPRYGGSESPDAWLLESFGAGTLGSILKSNESYI